MKSSLLILFIGFSITIFSQIPGCTDNLALNYNTLATINDGSCTYANTQVTPTVSSDISNSIHETSGLISWNNYIWTHNDNSDTNIYSINPSTGIISETINITGTTNNDWEAIAQDDNSIYIGDFGNNASGNRSDLQILKVDKQSILNNTPTFETLDFSYEDQSDITPVSGNTTDFDCEAMIINDENIFLFTKQWTSEETSLYSISKIAGSQIAIKIDSYNIDGLITGATYLEDKKLIVLCGYSSTLQPFVYLLYDFNDTDFFSGNKRKIKINLPFHQVEGIATTDGLMYQISNEAYAQPPLIDTSQRLHTIDLSVYLNDYLNGPTLSLQNTSNKTIEVYPNPASEYIIINNVLSPYQIRNQLGEIVTHGIINKKSNRIDINSYSNGIYFLTLKEHNQVFKILKN